MEDAHQKMIDVLNNVSVKEVKKAVNKTVDVDIVEFLEYLWKNGGFDEE